jgi:mono/diheme cytochrome c family protein
MVKRLLVGALLALILMTGIVTLAQEPGETGDPVQGAALYAEYCVACHTSDGGARAAVHPAFAAAITYDVSFEEVVAAGVPDTFMIGWSADNDGPLSDADIQDLRAYAQSWQSEEPVALPAPAIPADLSPQAALGAELYAVNCAGCHAMDGQGRDLEHFPAIGPDADVLTVARRGIADAMMPPFAQDHGGPLTEDELNAIMTYVRTWEQPDPLVKAAEEGPEGVGLLILLIGLFAVAVLVGGTVLAGQRSAEK